jgi:hypothetical protein
MPRIAVAIELFWSLPYHYEIVRGVQQFADEAGDWELDIGSFPEVRIEQGFQYDGIVGRITPSLLKVASAVDVPVVNTWVSSPVAARLPNVHCNTFAAGEIGAERCGD